MNEPDKNEGVRRLSEQALEHHAPFAQQKQENADLAKVIHELQVHQIELEMQNDELRRTQEELAQSRDRFLRLFHCAPVGYLVLDSRGCIMEANRTFCSMVGGKDDAVLGKWLSDFILENEEAEFTARYHAFFAKPDGKKLETVLGDAEGNRLDVALEGVRVKSVFKPTQGDPRLMLLVRDITQQKKDDAEKLQLQEQLLHSQKLETVGRLAGGIAHDFNNKLQAILGFCEMAMEEIPKASPAYDYLTEVQHAAAHSAKLTCQLLGFARKQAARPEVVNINETIIEIAGMLNRLIGENITLKMFPGDDLWSVYLDPVQLDQVLTNLLINGRDAITGEGTVTITTENAVLTETESPGREKCPPGEYVKLTVMDSGSGMDEATLARAFDPFFTTKQVGEGTGLGLSTVYGIITQNQGFVAISSEQGTGTAVTLYLPRCTDESERRSDGELSGLPALYGQETVLLVEDDQPVLEINAAMLKTLGYHVLTAQSAREAVALADAYNGRIDVLLTDLMLPDMHGRDMARKITRHHPDIKMLFTSGYGETTPGTGYDRSPVMQKPFSIAELGKRMKKLLEPQSSQPGGN